MQHIITDIRDPYARRERTTYATILRRYAHITRPTLRDDIILPNIISRRHIATTYFARFYLIRAHYYHDIFNIRTDMRQESVLRESAKRAC
jgi:hypothetical protein